MLREDIERRECETLIPCAFFSADSRGREHDEPTSPTRACYQRDRDRIIHCKAFRRLEYKTQVFLNHEGDHYRTRLTHTIEVTQIARTLARALGLNEDLTEAVALAHDVGHTPFGHSGEEVLAELMADHGGFEHNRQGLRVVDLLERRIPDFPGLNLTYEVRESIIKHHTRWDNPRPEGFRSGPALLEGQLVEVADAIAYDNHDLLDGLEANILTLAALSGVPLWREAQEAVTAEKGHLAEHDLCAQVVRHLIDTFVTDVVSFSNRRIQELGITSWQDALAQEGSVIGFGPQLQEKKADLEDALFRTLYRDYRVVRATNAAKRFVRAIFQGYVEDKRQLPPDQFQWAQEVGLHRSVCDYVAGMTDRYAQEVYAKFFLPYPKL